MLARKGVAAHVHLHGGFSWKVSSNALVAIQSVLHNLHDR
jgi:hypothetical protein